ncbi:MAG: class I SAM-dependent methyltransferase, partial [Chlorobi bacterium]|nr:class I SAM-dependent methyltransferase [Chlorobiota bacterium]
FFSNLQEAPWYCDFLNPVINEIDNSSRILDIGTGAGKMLQILHKEKQVTGVGIDTEQSMLDEAKKKLTNTPIQLYQIDAGKNYFFKNESFDSVTICSVLFNLKEKEAINQILSEALRVLKPNGKIVILTPTGKGDLINLTRHFFSLKNKGIYVWYNATKKGAKRWTKEQYLKKYSMEKNLIYTNYEIFKGFAQIEILTK